MLKKEVYSLARYQILVLQLESDETSSRDFGCIAGIDRRSLSAFVEIRFFPSGGGSPKILWSSSEITFDKSKARMHWWEFWKRRHVLEVVREARDRVEELLGVDAMNAEILRGAQKEMELVSQEMEVDEKVAREVLSLTSKDFRPHRSTQQTS